VSEIKKQDVITHAIQKPDKIKQTMV